MTEEDLDCLEPDEIFTEVCEDDDARVHHQKGNGHPNTPDKLCMHAELIRHIFSQCICFQILIGSKSKYLQMYPSEH